MALRFLSDTGLSRLVAIIKNALKGKSDTNHTHSYAGSSSVGGSATSAEKLTTDAGSTTQPIYFSNGVPVKTTHTLGASVPSGAKFTDTVYTLPTASSTLGGVKTTSTVTSTSGLTACPIIEGVPYYKDTNTTYTNEKLGQGYGTCSTAEATIAKAVTLSNYTLVKGGIVSVKFTYAVPASATLNVNSKGAKSIYYKGKAIIDGIIGAGEIATFMYDGSYYHLLNVDRTRFNPTFTPIGTQITASESAPVDLNTIPYLKVGNYFCSQNAQAKYITNLPENGVAFMMQVYSPLSATVDNETNGTWVYRIRRLTHYTGDEYIQYCYADGTAGHWNYGDWDKVIKASDTATQATKAQKDWSGNIITDTYATKTELNNGLNSKLNTTGGNVSGHLYLTGAQPNSSTGNTSQIVFGTSTDNHVAISSNNNALVINPDVGSTKNQIVLYLDKPSLFPSGIQGNLTGTASKATADASGNTITSTYATKNELNGKLSTTGGTLNGTTSLGGTSVGTLFEANSTNNPVVISSNRSGEIVSQVEIGAEGLNLFCGDNAMENGSGVMLANTLAGLVHPGDFLITKPNSEQSEGFDLNFMVSEETILIGTKGIGAGDYIAMQGNGNAIQTHKGYLAVSVNGYACDTNGNIEIPSATTSKSGVMSTADKTKLNNTPTFTYSTTDIGSGASLDNGTIYIVYE